MPAVRIGAPSEVLNGPLSPYDLDFFMEASDLPCGDLIRFHLSGNNIERLATREGCIELAEERSFPILLSCLAIDKKGRQMVDENDRKWILTLAIDPPTRLLVVTEAKPVPVWCDVCCTEIL
ncbi:hypothetical protein GGS24DRAFT_383169 [Hypoxylon argillaceum]|nr:hypothetical protein GGS24DRAFT_383169 [Hypoxylon argillaceum]KAI1155776.1 hypothetical protein F4825DRAFT_11452 [Nemania diffusa]